MNIYKIGEFLEKVADLSESVYWLSSSDLSKIIYISPAYEKIWGRPRQLLYDNPELWISYLHPDDAKAYHPIHSLAKSLFFIK
ncbi:MAG: PAS domain-containing protein [Proteobacteria bacterium]|nr:PAS domain-containing protein [Pseudomonadota bacterium]